MGDCRRHPLCALDAEHSGGCDPRPEPERWAALHRLLDQGLDGDELTAAVERDALAALLEAVAKRVVANGESLKTPGRYGRWLGIREVCIEIERQMGEETDIHQIHRTLLKVANLSPRDDPQDREWIERQWPFGWDPGTGTASDRRLVVWKRE